MADEVHMALANVGKVDILSGFNDQEGAVMLFFLSLKPVQDMHSVTFFRHLLDTWMRCADLGPATGVASKVCLLLCFTGSMCVCVDFFLLCSSKVESYSLSILFILFDYTQCHLWHSCYWYLILMQNNVNWRESGSLPVAFLDKVSYRVQCVCVWRLNKNKRMKKIRDAQRGSIRGRSEKKERH